VKRFDYIKLSEDPTKSIAHCNDWQTSVVIAPLPLSVVIAGPCLIFMPNFKLMLYSNATVVFNVGESTPRGRFGDLRDLGGDFSLQEGDFHWCNRQGSRRIPKRFDMVKIREKSMEIWAKSLKSINICQSVYIMQQAELWTFLV